jgi:proteasome lid subunit RPN8/RPN11
VRRRGRLSRVWLSERTALDVVGAAVKAHPIEIGGVLLGVYTEGGRPWVVRSVTIESANAGRAHYELPAGARPRCVDEARMTEPRLGYLGDWHSHPADVDASDTDIATMRQLASDAEALAPHPLLLIARRSGPDKYWLDMREFAGRRLRKLRVLASGGLKPVEVGRGGPRPRRRLEV